MANTINGTENSETLNGTNGNDEINGFGGDDAINGLGGDDNLRGGEGDDTINGGDGNDIIIGEGGDDTLIGGNGSDFIAGDAGNDIINLGAGDNEGADGGAGNDTIDGGPGFDNVQFSSSPNGVNVELNTDTGSGTAFDDGFGGVDTFTNIEFIIGSQNADTITLTGSGDGGNVSAGAGDDTLIGGNGSDFISGDAGNDIINGGDGNDFLQGGDGNDTLNGGDGRENFIGGAGDDIINGGGDRIDAGNDGQAFNDQFFFNADEVSYQASTSGVNVNFATGIALDGLGGTDTLIDIARVRGTAFDDVFTGSSRSEQEQFRPEAGNDIINGGDGFDRLRYDANVSAIVINASNVVRNGLQAGTADDGQGGIDTFTSIESFNTRIGDDIIFGGDADETFRTNSGTDFVDGGGGVDRLDFSFATGGGAPTQGIDIDLAAGTVTDHFGNNETFTSIEVVRGSILSDTIRGDGGDNRFDFSEGGDDFFDGRGGIDTINFDTGRNGGAFFEQIVPINGTTNINLTTGTAIDAQGNTHTIQNIENAIGSGFNDTIIGDSENNVLDGRGGGDFLAGAGGNDTIDGGEGSSGNIASFAGNIENYTISEDASGTITVTDNVGSEGTDTLTNIDFINFSGQATSDEIGTIFTVTSILSGNFTPFDSDVQIIRGTALNDQLDGTAGNDIILGLQGNDLIRGSAGNDFIDAGDDLDQNGIRRQFQELDLRASPNAVNVNLSTGIVQDGFGGTDIVSNFVRVRGTDDDDIFVGSDAMFENFRPEAGNDTIDGGAGIDRVRYDIDASIIANLSGSVREGVAAGTVLDGEGGIDTVTNIEEVQSTFGSADDRAFGGDGDETFRLGDGADFVDGGGGNDELDFAFSGNATQGIVVDLQAGTATDHFGNSETFVSIEEVRGTQFTDTILGSSVDNTFRASFGGNDLIDGRGGIDTLIFSENIIGGTLFTGNPGIFVDLTSGVATSFFGEVQTLISIENITGSAFDDTIIGDAGSNLIDGDGGDDVLTGGAGADTFRFDVLELGIGNAIEGFGSDIITDFDALEDSFEFQNIPTSSLTVTQSGSDVVIGVVGLPENQITVLNSTVGAIEPALGIGTPPTGNAPTSGDDVLTGTAGIDVIDGLGGNDTINGLGGNDLLIGGAGADTLNGGEGDDILRGGTGADVINGNGGIDTNDFSDLPFAITANITTGVATYGPVTENFTGIENLTGANLDDQLTGDGGNNVLNGLGGNDTLIGGLGFDTLNGGAGLDTADYASSDASVFIDLFGNPNFGGDAFGDTFISIENITGSAFGDIIGGNQEANVLNGGGGADQLTGFGGDDTINGGAGADIIQGVSGNNTLNGGDDGDIIFGGAGIDTINGDAGADTLFGDGSDDTLNGGADNDALVGGIGGDTLNGDGGSDFIIGNAGMDIINGGADGDTAVGGDDNDTINGDGGSDALLGEGGDDTLNGGTGFDFLSGGAGIDTLNGGADGDLLAGGLEGDTLNGDAGDDVIFGEEGNDFINGGSGTDFLLGDAGNDTFIFNAGNDADVVLDFEDNLDTLDLSSFGFANVAAALAVGIEDSGNVFFNFDNGDTLNVFNVTEAQLADDIIV